MKPTLTVEQCYKISNKTAQRRIDFQLLSFVRMNQEDSKVHGGWREGVQGDCTLSWEGHYMYLVGVLVYLINGVLAYPRS